MTALTNWLSLLLAINLFYWLMFCLALPDVTTRLTLVVNNYDWHVPVNAIQFISLATIDVHSQSGHLQLLTVINFILCWILVCCEHVNMTVLQL